MLTSIIKFMIYPVNMSEFFRIVRIKGTPFQMGVDHGQQVSDLIRRRINSNKDFYKKIGYSEELVKKIRERSEEGIKSVSPDLIEEVRGIAEGAGVSYEDTMNAYMGVGDALRHKVEENCTTTVVTGKATKNGNPIIGHNWDARGRKSIIVIDAKPKKGYNFIAINSAGRPGCEGMNENGLTIVMSGVIQRRREEFLDGTGPLYVPPVWTHHILSRCKNVDEAIKVCKDTFRKAIHGSNWVIGDPDTFAHAEISFDKIKIKYLETDSSDPNDWILSTTNHYESAEFNSMGPSEEEYPNSYARKRRMTYLLKSKIGDIDLSLVKTFHRDHIGKYPICRHGGSGSNERLETISSEIGQPKELRFWIAMGPPCENDYKVFQL